MKLCVGGACVVLTMYFLSVLSDFFKMNISILIAA